MELKEETKFIERRIAVPLEWFERLEEKKCKHHILLILEDLPNDMWKEYEQIKNHDNNRN